MVDYIYSVFYSLVMVFLIIQFGKAFLIPKGIGRLISALLIVEWVAVLCCLSYISHNILVRLIVIIAASSIHFFVFFKTTWVRSLILSVISTSLFTIIDFAVYFLKYLLVPEMSINTIFDYTISYYLGFGSQLIQLIAIIIITRTFNKTDKAGLSTRTWFRHLVIPFGSLALICLVSITMDTGISKEMGRSLFAFAMGLMCLTVYIYYFLKRDFNREIESEKNKMLYHHAEELQTAYNQLRDERERLAKDNHEFKNKVVAWSSLLRNGEYSELLEMMGKENSISTANSDVLSTGNRAIDVVLNAKYFEAVNKGISFEFNLNNLTDVHIDATDLIILLSNVLNNAIEACEKCDSNPEIAVKGVYKLNRFILTVRNTYNGELNDNLGTTKEDKSLHGYGIEAITNIVNKYNGHYYFEHEGNLFTTYIVIPM